MDCSVPATRRGARKSRRLLRLRKGQKNDRFRIFVYVGLLPNKIPKMTMLTYLVEHSN